MKLENYTGAADTFNFPHNSRAFNDKVDKFVDQKDYNYTFSYFGFAHPVMNRRNIIINGFFDDTGTGNRVNNIRDLMKHANDNKLKKLYFSADNFYIVIPVNVECNHTGGRTMFRDYIASFISPFGILFSNTQKDGDKNSAEKNVGNVFTPIERIEITGLISGTSYSIIDKDGNGFTFDANTSGDLVMDLIELRDLGRNSFFTEYFFTTINGTKQVIKLATIGKAMMLGLEPDQSLSNAFTGGSADVPSNTTFYFRDGFSSE